MKRVLCWLKSFFIQAVLVSPQHAGGSTVCEGSNAGFVNLRGIPPEATHLHVIGDPGYAVLQPCNRSLSTQIPAQAHPHPRLTGPWQGASVGRQELLVQCPCTHHRSIPL